MNKLELWYPANNHPFMLNQIWGLFNPAYQQFGFTRHNGIDIPIAPDKAIYCPVRAKVTDVGFIPTGAGNYVELTTTDKWNVNGADCYVRFNFFHNEAVLVKIGDICEVGTKLSIPDNTGFTTGPHTHNGYYRMNDDMTKMDMNDAHGSFDPMPYMNGFYASDKDKVLVNLATQITILKKVVQLLLAFKK